MATYTSPTDVTAGSLAKSSDLNNIDAATAAAFALLPTNANINAGTVNFAVDTGTANAYLVALPQTAASYSDGLTVAMRPLYANTGACTINVDSLGIKSIRTEGNTTPAANDIVAGVPVELRYSTTTGFFHISKNSAAAAVAAAASAAAALVSENAASASASAASGSASSASSSAGTATAQASASSISAAAALVSQNAALVSQNAAGVSAAAALVSENNAETAETNAELAETNAETAETNAAASAAAALVSENNTASLYDNFDDRYLGAKAVEPTLDNDGNALITGAMYFNTVSNLMKVYSGSAWLVIGASEVAGDGIDVTFLGGEVTISVDLKANGGLVIESTELALDLGASSITGTLAVGDGGTGRTTGTTAYSLIATGTTATGAQQTLANGLATQILVGGGASALPVWGTDIPTAVTIGTAYVYRAGGTDVAVADGGTGVGTFTLNGILYGNSATSVLVTAAGTAQGQLLTCGATPFVPAWTTATYPGTTTINQILYSSAANTVSGLATGNSSVLVTNGSGVPSLATDIPTAVTIGTKYIYRAEGTDIPVTDGGTGVSTLTTAYGLLAAGTTATGALQTLAAGATTQILVGGGASALPAWGTDIPAAVTIGGAYITRVGGTDVTVTDGGTGASTLADGGLVIGNGTGAVEVVAAGTTTQILVGGGASTAPVWGTDLPTAVTIGSQYVYRAAGTDVPVTDGGTGRSTGTTAYALVATGTTATGAQQTLASGATTEILVGGGASALPVWTTATGTGAPVRATSPTLDGTPLSSTPSDNTATTQIATTAFAKSQDAVLKREPDQAVNMTAAAGGSSGITVADNDNIDFGTGNFTLVWKGSLPDWTPSAGIRLFSKYGAAGYILGIEPDNSIITYLNGTSWVPSIIPSFVNGSVHEITVVYTVGAVNTTADFYCDGAVIGTQVSHANVGSVNVATDLSILGYDAIRTAGTCSLAATYNRALTAAEVLDRYRNGVNYADKWGSQTEQTSGTLTIGKRYRINNWITNDDFTNVGGANVDGTEFVATGTTPTTWTNSSTVVPAGATLCLEPEGIQQGRWLDSTSNHLDATWPAAGASMTRPIPNQPVLTNLLTNSKWVATSGSTLCEVTSGAAPVTDGANAALVNNLLTNGGFDSVTTGWTATGTGDAPVLESVAGGKTGNELRITQNAAGNTGYAYQAATTVVGKIYQASVYFKKGTAAAGSWGIGTSATGKEVYSSAGIADADWTQYTKVFEATATTTYITVNGSGAGSETSLFDSITLYEVTPGYVAADTLAPDGWDKTSGVQIWRQHKDATYTKEGSFYSLKVTGDGSAGTVFWSDGGKVALPEFYYKYAGTPQAFAMWVWCASASKARIGITDSAGTTWSNYHSGGSTWEWLEMTRTPATSITSFKFVLDAGISTTAYFSHDMGVHGSSIGQGNYQPIPNEEIWLQTPTAITPSSSPASGYSLINLEAISNGVIGKGIKKISGYWGGKNSAAGKYLIIYSVEGGTIQSRQSSIVANVAQYADFQTRVNPATGDITLRAEDVNWSEVEIVVTGIQT